MNETSSPPVPISLQPSALLFFLSHQDTYRQPLFSRSEVFCGPDAESRSKGNQVLALKSPVGSFPISDVLKHLPSDQCPELLVVKADATRRNLPRNLAAFKGPKVLLVGDTHHFHQPLRTLIKYAQQEPFDFIIFDHTRHHARFFAEAGCRNLFWLPALDYGYVPQALVPRPARPLTFVGQAGKHHPYRCAVLEQVRAAGLSLEVLQAPLAKTAEIYANSQVTLNVSLNGDLNLRVFEALAAGGFLLTDELSPDSGLDRLFEAGKHLDTWRTPDELIAKIRHYHAHPEEAQRIRRAGQEEIQRHHTPTVKLREFYDLIGTGKVNPKYDFRDEPWFNGKVTVPSPGVPRRIAAHEAIQGLHQGTHRVELVGISDALKPDFAGLPRVETTTAAGAASPAGVIVQRVLCCDEALKDEDLIGFDGQFYLALADSAVAQEKLAAWGLAPVDSESPLLRLARPGQWLDQAWESGNRDLVRERLGSALVASRTAEDCLAVARYAEELGDAQQHLAALEAAVALDRSNTVALVGQAASLLEQGEPEGVTLMLEEAARLQPLPAEIKPLHVQLLEELAHSENLTHYFRVTGRQPVEQAITPLKVLLVTNLLPPQELGGYGRMMWEFAHGLKARGHQVRVLTANLPEFAKPANAEEAEMEACVNRTLELAGTWRGGKAVMLEDRNAVMRRVRDNTARIRTAVAKQQPDLVLVGNLDLIGLAPLRPALDAEIPVLHTVANASPGFALEEMPLNAGYCIAPCSDWNGQVLGEAGFRPSRTETVYPGARVDRFFRFFLPDTRSLRICYASLVLPYKGAHTLLAALVQLHRAGIEFTAEIAGDAPDAQFFQQLQEIVRDYGMDAKVKFTGFLDRDGLVALYARSNVLVFPSIFQEPFGISQVEAMASGLVVVSSGTGGAKEVVRDGVDGLLFKAGDAADLAEKLTSLHREPDRAAQLQRGAQARAVQFSVDASVRKIENLAAEIRSSIEATKLAEVSELPTF